MNPDLNDYLAAANMLGFTMPSMGYIVGALLFSTIGIFVYRTGRRTHNIYVTILGIVLMLFTYVISNTTLVFGLGAGFCLAAWCAHISQEY